MKNARISWVAGLASLWALSASATPISVAFQGFSNGSQNGSISGVRDAGVAAGQFEFNVVSGVFWDTTLDAFCIDVTTNLITGGSASYDLLAANTSTRLNNNQRSLIASLYDQHGSQITSATNSAAFQLALWEIVYDSATSLALGNGSFSGSGFGSSLTTAQSWLGGLNTSGTYSSSNYDFFVLEAPNNDNGRDINQSLLLVKPTSVPEPGTLALLSAGLIACGLARRRRVA
jgi:PEP-CTERM motif-containing protein